ncbi:MAG: DUF4465 domain-containing protein [Spirochaetota bacterium]
MDTTNFLIRSGSSLYRRATRLSIVLVFLSLVFHFFSCSEKKEDMPIEMLVFALALNDNTARNDSNSSNDSSSDDTTDADAATTNDDVAQETTRIAPVLNALSIGSVDATSITLNQPTFATTGNPTPSVNAYIGLDGTISVSGATVNNSLQGPIDVASESHLFSGLLLNTSYRIIVVAENTAGYSVKQMLQNTSSTQTTVVTFDDNSLSPDSHYGGAGSGMGDFTSHGVSFPHTDATHSWSEFAYSNKTDKTTAGFINQFSVYNSSGAEGSANFCISYVALDWMGGTYDPIPNAITFGSVTTVSGAYFTNTTYAALSMLTGDTFAKKFGGVSGNDADWFLLTITGKDNSGTATGSIQFYLADYRFADNANDYVIDEWTWVDLSSLGTVKSIEFILTSSDDSAFGMNTPAYFALDNVTIQK